jgi:hypothetical protein
MKNAKKRMDESEYAKLCLQEATNPVKCSICKYNSRNYIEGGDAYLFLFESKCKSCTQRYYGYIGKDKPWIINNFKPLYEWEEEDERQS